MPKNEHLRSLALLERLCYHGHNVFCSLHNAEKREFMTAISLTPTDLRRLAISRQHLNGTSAGMLEVIRDLGCLQLDPISAVARSHQIVLWSRLGSYDPAEFDRLMWQDRALFEYWAHEASIVLTEDYPIHHMRMRTYPSGSAWGRQVQAWLDSDPEGIRRLRESILSGLREHGAKPARFFEDTLGRRDGVSTGWTGSSSVNKIIDYLWLRGEIMVAGRPGTGRIWELAERWLPEWTPREEITPEEATRRAAQKAIRALGAATEPQIKIHYIRRRYEHLKHVLNALEHEGIIYRAQIVPPEGKAWGGVWYIHRDDLPLLERIQSGDWTGRIVLLSPFDNLICDRKRTSQLFNFDFTIEIYVPKEKRKYGYYVLPILHGDLFIGRIDPLMDRKTQTLRINAFHVEPAAPNDAETIKAVRGAIKNLAAWLGAKRIDYCAELPRGWAKVK